MIRQLGADRSGRLLTFSTSFRFFALPFPINHIEYKVERTLIPAMINICEDVMKYYTVNWLVMLSFIFVFYAILLMAQKYGLPIFFDIAVSLFFAIVFPFGFVHARRQVRLSRLHTAEVFRKTYEGSLSSNTYFEFLKRKYFLNNPASGPETGTVKPNSKYLSLPLADWLMLGAALPLSLLLAAGFFLLLLPVKELVYLFDGLGGNMSAGTDAQLNEPNSLEGAIILGKIAFVGAFLYCLRLFIKSLVAFDLSALTLLRGSAHLLFAVMLAVMIWRITPSAEPLTDVASKVQNTLTSDNKVTLRQGRQEQQAALSAKTDRLPKIWLILAVAIGFVPDAAFSWLLHRSRLALNRRDARMARQTPVVPLTIIDGIDFFTAFRLEEGSIAGVQNLAVANPVMLHVETPYCVFLIMDWIAQAQLCAAVGPERFLLFKKLNIRTIFDLERAVLDPQSPVGLKQIMGSVLLATSPEKPSLLREFGVRPLDLSNRDFGKALNAWVNIEVVEHLVRVMMDSLHIQRFRQLWRDLEGSLMPLKSDKLPRARILPSPAAVSAASNGGARDPHALEIAAGGKPARDMQTEIHGD
jgi:hypothetical protein